MAEQQRAAALDDSEMHHVEHLAGYAPNTGRG
jgi:hypothetical protein